MKYKIICAIEVEADNEEMAQNKINEQIRGKASMFVDYIEPIEIN
jgi:hypothetical protein